MRKSKGRIGRGAALALGVLLLAGSTAAEAKENESLYLYIEDSTEEEYRVVFDAYREAYPEVDLQIDTYSSSEYREARTKRNTMLMAGEGPDLLLFGIYDNDDVYKVMDSGLFAPLDELMAADEAYSSEGYVKNVLDAGIFGSSQYMIPLQYDVSCLISSRECLEEIGFDLEACGTFEGLFSQVAALYDTDYSYRVLGRSGTFDNFPDKMGVKLLDYETDEVLVDTPEMKTAMEQYKKMYEECTTDPNLETNGFSDTGRAICERTAYLAAGYGMYDTLSVCRGISETETPVILPVPTLDGRNSGAIVSSAAVRANSENKENAWNMIRMLLEYQAQGVGLNGVYFPVNLEGLQYVEDAALRDVELYESGGEISQEILEDYRRLIQEPEYVYFFRGITMTDFTGGEMVPYFTGAATYEECMERYIEYAKIYVSE